MQIVWQPLPPLRLLTTSLREKREQRQGTEFRQDGKVTLKDCCSETSLHYCFRDGVYKGFFRGMGEKVYLVIIQPLICMHAESQCRIYVLGHAAWQRTLQASF